MSELFPGSEREIVRYASLLATAGVERGAIGPREVNRIWERHLLNCLSVVKLFEAESEVLDVGSGAGLPGLVIALARPDLRITLLDPLLRRVVLLTEFVEELGLGERVTVLRGRAQDHQRQYRYVTARAVASLERLLPICWPLVAPNGALLALKGEGAVREVDRATALFARLKVGRVEVIESPGFPEAPQPGRVISIER